MAQFFDRTGKETIDMHSNEKKECINLNVICQKQTAVISNKRNRLQPAKFGFET